MYAVFDPGFVYRPTMQDPVVLIADSTFRIVSWF